MAIGHWIRGIKMVVKRGVSQVPGCLIIGVNRRQGTRLKSCMLFLCMLVVVMTLVHLLMYNVHTSTVYIQRQARLYPANFTISRKCVWAKNGSFDFDDYKPKSFVLIIRLLAIVFDKYGIMTIMRDGAFLHLFRRIKADNDMDVYIIVPKHLTLTNAYFKIRFEIENTLEFKNITLETQNTILSALIFHKSDGVRICYNDEKIVDVDVLHETFLNDPGLQEPCIGQMNCQYLSEQNDPYLKAKRRHITTKNLFQSLCQCNYMGSSVFCFNENGAQYLEVRYGTGYMRKLHKPEVYPLIYERPYRPWRYLLSAFPPLFNIKFAVEGHSKERLSNHLPFKSKHNVN